MADHSDKFFKVQRYYDENHWNAESVGLAVEHNWITPREYEDITGEQYEVNENRELTATEFIDILIGGES